MNAQEKLNERLKLFDDTIAGLPTHRVPTVSNDFTWRLMDTDCGLKPNDAYRDFDKFAEITFEFQERYNYDVYEMSGMRNNFRICDAVGGTHSIDDETGAIQALDRCYLEGDELEEFAHDTINTLWQKVAPRAFGEVTYEQMANAIKACYEQYATEDRIVNTLIEKYGVPASSRIGGFMPIEELFNQYRGIKGLSIDMRRNFDKIEDVCECRKSDYLTSYGNTFRAGHRGSGPISVWDANTTMLASSVMNMKQFETFYWKTYKEMLDIAVENGCTIFQFTEGSLIKFADFFKDVPKGTISLLVENDDISEMRKLLPNITFIGGMDISILGNGTPAECVDEAKRIIDTLYPNFIFSTNKMVSFRRDCKRENLLAVQDFVLNYDPMKA